MFLGAGSKSVTGASISASDLYGTSWNLTVSVGNSGGGDAQTDSGTGAKSNAKTWTFH